MPSLTTQAMPGHRRRDGTPFQEFHTPLSNLDANNTEVLHAAAQDMAKLNLRQKLGEPTPKPKHKGTLHCDDSSSSRADDARYAVGPRTKVHKPVLPTRLNPARQKAAHADKAAAPEPAQPPVPKGLGRGLSKYASNTATPAAGTAPTQQPQQTNMYGLALKYQTNQHPPLQPTAPLAAHPQPPATGPAKQAPTLPAPGPTSGPASAPGRASTRAAAQLSDGTAGMAVTGLHAFEDLRGSPDLITCLSKARRGQAVTLPLIPTGWHVVSSCGADDLRVLLSCGRLPQAHIVGSGGMAQVLVLHNARLQGQCRSVAIKVVQVASLHYSQATLQRQLDRLQGLCSGRLSDVSSLVKYHGYIYCAPQQPAAQTEAQPGHDSDEEEDQAAACPLSQGVLFILQDYCELGSLQGLADDLAAQVKEANYAADVAKEARGIIWYFGIQVLLALKSLHAAVRPTSKAAPAPTPPHHRDLKPQNIFMAAAEGTTRMPMARQMPKWMRAVLPEHLHHSFLHHRALLGDLESVYFELPSDRQASAPVPGAIASLAATTRLPATAHSQPYITRPFTHPEAASSWCVGLGTNGPRSDVFSWAVCMENMLEAVSKLPVEATTWWHYPDGQPSQVRPWVVVGEQRRALLNECLQHKLARVPTAAEVLEHLERMKW